MSTQKTWLNDWESFIKSICEHFGHGLGDSAVAEKFAGKRVVWTGKVREKRFDIDRPGVQMDMPAICVELADGRRATADYLFLTLKSDELPLWGDVEAGAAVRFSTQTLRSNGPFSGIRWGKLDDKRGVIMFSTEGAIPIRQ